MRKIQIQLSEVRHFADNSFINIFINDSAVGEIEIRDKDCMNSIEVCQYIKSILEGEIAKMSSDMEQKMQDQIEGALIDEEHFRKRLHRLFNLGQTYWSEADSESYSANKRSKVTHQKAMALIDELISDISARGMPALEAEGE